MRPLTKLERLPGNLISAMSLRHKPLLAVLLSLIFAASTWFYFQRVLIPEQLAYAAAHGIPRGNLSDLYPRWLGARELLLHHRDPYSAEVTREIQMGYYGRPLDPSRPDDPKDQVGFVYPVYVVFLIAPTVHLPFQDVQAVFRAMLWLLSAASVLLWLRFLQWRPSGPILAALLIMTISSFSVVQGIKLQQLTLVVAVMIAGSAALLAGGHLFLAGILLALATIKPQIAVLPAAWLLLWSVSQWRERQRLFWGFAFTISLLMGGAEYLLPGWISRFCHAILAYRHYAGGGAFDLLLTPKWGTVLTVLALLGLAGVCRRLRKYPAHSPEFALVFSLLLAMTLVVIPMTSPYNQVLLLPGVFLLARSWSLLWARNSVARFLCVLAAALILWPWLASLGLMLGALAVPPSSLQGAWAVPLYSMLGIPPVIAGLLALLLSDVLRDRKRDGTVLEGATLLR